MEHPVLFWCTLIALLLVFIGWLMFYGHATVNRYEYLEVMSYTEWIPGRTLCKTLEKKHGGWIGYGEFYVNMSILKDEGLVESRDSNDEDGLIREFRKIGSGPRKREPTPTFIPQLYPA